VSEAWLVVNAGSSSIRCALYARGSLAPLLRVHVAAIGDAAAQVRWSGELASRCAGGVLDTADHERTLAALLQALATCLPDIAIAGAGHRVVHGGREFDTAVVVDADVEQRIGRLAPLAPSHQPHNLAAIRAIAARAPAIAQVACFDTAFHRSQPRLARLLAVPRALSDAGIERYGFHGLSYQYLAGALPQYTQRADGRVIIAHLGHGASLCALRERRSVATTMGFSTLDGLMMGTRCGALDPGVLLHLLHGGRYDAAGLDDLLYRHCGLLGVSGISDDVRVLEASADPRAREALDLFAYRAAGEIGALAAAIGGVDVLVFSGGIGENSVAMRAAIAARTAWLGVALDADANAAARSPISTAASAVEALVIPTDEEIVIARATQELLGTL
jgi:acetate kinase